MNFYYLYYFAAALITVGLVVYGIRRSQNKDGAIPFEGTFLSLYYTKEDRRNGRLSNKTKVALTIITGVTLTLLFLSSR